MGIRKRTRKRLTSIPNTGPWNMKGTNFAIISLIMPQGYYDILYNMENYILELEKLAGKTRNHLDRVKT